MKKIIIIALLTAIMAVPAFASPIFSSGGAALQEVLDDVTTAPTAGDSSVNVTTDFLSDSDDSYWALTGGTASVSTIVFELAASDSSNKFGVYSGGKYVELFAGSDVAGQQAVLVIKFDGSVYKNFQDTGIDFTGNNFGFYLDTRDGTTGGLWHSDSGLNTDGKADHMAAYQGADIDTIQTPGWSPGLWTNNEFVLAWEGLDFIQGTDSDYTDFVVIVESVSPVPAACLGAIGDFVWMDDNGDGIQDDGELGIEGVTVILDDDQGTWTTVTDANGFYMFNGLCPGNYTVSVDSLNFTLKRNASLI